MKLLTILSLATIALAKSYANCGCAISGEYNKDLAQCACDHWTQNGGPGHWDGYSCVYKNIFDGIPADSFAGYCQYCHLNDPNSVGSYCWHP
ncbi:hypothetical protein E4U55_008158 [Claviceps digitariae]|nr:hypothetical protein E4U55_008158 [Claviceps digitariae]